MERTTYSKFNSLLHSARTYLTPVLAESNFNKTGLITPEEFIACGDFLVSKCSSWSWSAVDYLPAEKQYLVTKGVACPKRVVDLEGELGEEDVDGLLLLTGQEKQDVQDIDEQIMDLDEIPDMDELEGFGTITAEDIAQAPNVVKTRTYDITITYDKYYQTPRVWLVGYDEYGMILSSEQVIMINRGKTATVERHPHEHKSVLSIHPCQHSNVMKSMIDIMDNDTIRVDQYLMVFLKFMQTVLPTMEYDYL